jgi:hypothetical protein
LTWRADNLLRHRFVRLREDKRDDEVPPNGLIQNETGRHRSPVGLLRLCERYSDVILRLDRARVSRPSGRYRL